MLGKDLISSISGEFVETLRAYVAATLHRPVQISRWDGATSLPLFLAHRYNFFAALIGSQPCLFAADRGAVDARPADVAKHIARIESAFDGIVIYAARNVAADRRSRLVAGGVPFVVPGNQLYIPPLALDLRENFRSRPMRRVDQLSPVAQAVLFYGILFKHELGANSNNRSPSLLAKALGYSAMSVGRAFEELTVADLAAVTKRGRSKEILFADDSRSLIEIARPMLRKPVRSRKLIQCRPTVPPMKVAGESALGEFAGLSPPRVPVFAVHGDDWSSLSASYDVVAVGETDRADAVVELWYYHPEVLTENPTVDPLSLYAQYWNDANERIAKAAEDGLDHVRW